MTVLGCLKYFTVEEKETFLFIGVDEESYSDNLVFLCKGLVTELRSGIEKYIQRHPRFQTSFRPVRILPDAPQIILRMADAANAANVGPMAAVAGAVAEAIGERISCRCTDIIIENGGDIYIRSSQKRTICVFAGETKFSYRIGIEIRAEETPLGICTSSGTTGHSISLGKADAVSIKANTASLADAVATSTANLIHTSQDIKTAIEFARKVPGVTGVLAIKDDTLGVWGGMKLVEPA